MVLSAQEGDRRRDVLSFQHALPSIRAQVEYSAPPVTAAQLPRVPRVSPPSARANRTENPPGEFASHAIRVAVSST
jgi:hypothetical protein